MLTHICISQCHSVITESNAVRCRYNAVQHNMISVFKIRSETCRTEAQFCQNSYMKKKESFPDRPKFCLAGSTVQHLFWKLWYCIHHSRDWCKIWIRVWTHKRHPITHPNGWAMGCILCWFWKKNWTHYNGTTLYNIIFLDVTAIAHVSQRTNSDLKTPHISVSRWAVQCLLCATVENVLLNDGTMLCHQIFNSSSRGQGLDYASTQKTRITIFYNCLIIQFIFLFFF